MKLRGLLAVVAAVFLVGCSTLSFDSSRVQGSYAASIGYQSYIGMQQVSTNVSGNHVIALLAYSCNDIYRMSPMNTFREYGLVFASELETINRSGIISANYPVRPSNLELRLWQQFNAQWLADIVKTYAAPTYAQESYAANVRNFISRILDHDYNRQ